MEIRAADSRDIGRISELYQEFFLHTASLQPAYYRAALENGDYPKYVIESGDEDLFVAAINGKVVGLVHVTEGKTPPFDCYVPHRYATVVDLYVSPDFRGKGIGTALMGAAKLWARDRSLDYLELSVLTENVSAVKFYEHAGFRTVSHLMRLFL